MTRKPTSEELQRALFELLGDTRASIGVTLTERLVMVPVKTVSGIFFANDEGFAGCHLCPREGGPDRKAPHEPGLYERKYSTRLAPRRNPAGHNGIGTVSPSETGRRARRTDALQSRIGKTTGGIEDRPGERRHL